MAEPKLNPRKPKTPTLLRPPDLCRRGQSQGLDSGVILNYQVAPEQASTVLKGRPRGSHTGGGRAAGTAEAEAGVTRPQAKPSQWPPQAGGGTETDSLLEGAWLC